MALAACGNRGATERATLTREYWSAETTQSRPSDEFSGLIDNAEARRIVTRRASSCVAVELYALR